ncbi:RlpA-like double-psi beta-barrel-protein domain-containing protein-containing protein [Trametes polyzona]|nr:RlpA-like double-psi beta-barrel-protein domain-containing protein-containing protein [Trametes polyzona]
MFSPSRSFFLTLLTVTAAAFAAPAPHGGAYHPSSTGVTHSHINRHNVALDVDVRGLEKRHDNARFTYYDAGENACGSVDDGNAFVIALSPAMYNNGAHCFKQVTVMYNGKKVQATVTDECPGCTDAQADLSRPLFQSLAPLDKGVIYGSWWFD